MGGLKAVAGQFFLRVVEVDGLGKYARASDFRHERHALQVALDKVGKIVELAVREFLAGVLGQLTQRLLRISDDERMPNIRMDFRDTKVRLGELPERRNQRRIVVAQARTQVERQVPRPLDDMAVAVARVRKKTYRQAGHAPKRVHGNGRGKRNHERGAVAFSCAGSRDVCLERARSQG